MRRVLGIRGDFASSAFVGIGGGRSDTHALRGRKAGGQAARIQRAKSFSCPQLLISQPSAAALPPVSAISAVPEQSSSSTASTSLSSSPTTTITSATPMSAVLPRRVLARLPGKQKQQQQQRKFGFVYPDRCDLFSAAPEVCPMLSRGGVAPDTQL